MLTFHHTWADFKEQNCTVAVLPIGAVEQHGAHLPVGTDVMLAEALAKPVAEHLDAYLLPAIAVSSSIEHRKAKGTVYLRADTLALVVRDIADALRTSGFTRLVVVNFHGGNWILKPTIRQFNRDHPDFRVALVQPDLTPADARAILEHPVGDIHGGEFETSLMLYLYPQAVRPGSRGGSRTFPAQPLLDYFDATELAPEGFWGWPEVATADKGRRAFEALVASSLDFLRQIEVVHERLSAAREEKLSAAASATAPTDVAFIGNAKASPPVVTLRKMRAEDVAFANELRASAGWNQTERDWRGYLDFEPDGCFVAEVDGRAAGTATTIRYGRKFGWIGMVLVDPAQRRLGIGSRLLRAAIDYLQGCGVRCVKLDATPMGKKVYVPLGFVEEYELARYEGVAPAVANVSGDPEIRPLAAADFADILQLDTAAFGADRSAVLPALHARHPELCFVARRGGVVTGFLFAREGANAHQVGPWVAQEPGVAEKLLTAFFHRAQGRRVFVDVTLANHTSEDLVKRYGFTLQRTLTRMYRGENEHPGDCRWVFGISSPEKG